MDNNSSNIKLEKQIDAYIKGKLSEEEAQDLWAQLLQEPEYIEYLQTEIDLVRLHKQRSEQKGRFTQYWKWFAAAAAVIAVVVGLNIFSSKGLNDFTVNNILLRESLATAPTMRSANPDYGPVDSLLNLGFERAVSGDIDEAVAIYNKVIAHHPHSVYAGKAHLNIAILKYNTSKYGEAVSNLKKVLSIIQKDRFIREQAYWYLSNAFINTGQYKKAKEALNQVYQLKGEHKLHAKRLLSKMSRRLATAQ